MSHPTTDAEKEEIKKRINMRRGVGETYHSIPLDADRSDIEIAQKVISRQHETIVRLQKELDIATNKMDAIRSILENERGFDLASRLSQINEIVG